MGYKARGGRRDRFYSRPSADLRSIGPPVLDFDRIYTVDIAATEGAKGSASMMLSPLKIMGVVLLLPATAFGVLGTLAWIWAAEAYLNWPKVDASVRSLSYEPGNAGKRGIIKVKLCYAGTSGENCAWALRSLPWGGSKFAHDYAVGTQHAIRLDPRNPAAADVNVGWNLDTVFVPVEICTICCCLFIAAFYFWRSP